MANKLYRSASDSMLGGVCGGLGDYFDADPNLIRLILVVLGVVYLLRNLGIPWLSWIAFGTLWPALLILVGVAFLWRWLTGGGRREDS